LNSGKKVILSPSLLSADFLRIGEQLTELKNAGADTLHVDVMDGAFVPNISFGQVVVASISKKTPLPLDVHLMIDSPERYIDAFNLPNVNDICVHVESTKHLNRVIQMIKASGIKPSVALNPSTPLSSVDWVLDSVGMVLVMSVNPGFGGQRFIDSTIGKIADLKTIIKSRSVDCLIGVDGGVNADNLKSVVDAGADYIVAGNFILSGKKPIADNVKLFFDIVG